MTLATKLGHLPWCTFCEKLAEFVNDGMCQQCDNESIAADRKFQAAQRYTTKPCRLCHKPLATNRYYHCEACDPSVHRESDDFDHIYHTYDIEHKDAQPVPAVLQTGFKTCACCKEEKSRIEFYRNPTNIGDSHRSYCKLCSKLKERSAKLKKALEKREGANVS